MRHTHFSAILTTFINRISLYEHFFFPPRYCRLSCISRCKIEFMFLAGLPSKHLPSFWTTRVLCMYIKRSLLGSLVAFTIQIFDDEAVLHIVKDVTTNSTTEYSVR